VEPVRVAVSSLMAHSMSSFNFQTNGYSCGTIALVNSVKVLDMELSYDDAKRLAGTTYRDGTSQRGLIRAIESLGLKATEYRTANADNAWKWLHKWADTCPVILLVDGYLTVGNSHWVTAVGRINGRVIVVDPTANTDNGENGTHPYSKEDLVTRWKLRICYAIRVCKQ